MKWLIIFVLFFAQFGFSICANCEEDLYEGPVHTFAYQSLQEAQKWGLHSPYRHYRSDWIRSLLENCNSYSVYRDKFEHLIWWANDDMEYRIDHLHSDIQETELTLSKLKSTSIINEHNIQYIKSLTDDIKRNEAAIQKSKGNLVHIQQILTKSLAEIAERCRKLYNYCIQNHNDQNSYYERSLVYFDQGKFSECTRDISLFLEKSEKIPQKTPLTEVFLAQGVSYSDLGLYNEAIKSLTKAIELDPENRKALLERSAAYFELGNLEQSIEDFITSDLHSSPIHSSILDFASGFIWGASTGFIEAVDTSIPSLLNSAKGLGNAIWAFAISPEQFSSQIVDACFECVKFLKIHSTPEILETISPNLKELIFEFDVLPDHRRGQILGHLIGKEGIEFFAAAKSLKAFRELKQANMIATLEATASPTLREKIIEKTEQWGSKHVETIKKIRENDIHIKTLKRQNLSESTIRKTLHELGYPTFPKPNGLPDNFKVTFSDKKGGMKYIDPRNEHHYVRVMPGNLASPNSWQHKPYVNHMKDGEPFDKFGNKTNRASQAAHIPLDEFIYQEK